MEKKSLPFFKLYESNHKERDEIKKHSHTTYQILYVLKGCGMCYLDGKHYELEPDILLVIAPLTIHSILAKTKMTVLVLEFDAGVVSEDIQNHMLAEAFEQSKLRKLNTFDGSEFRQLLRKMLYEQSNADHISHFVIRIHIAEMIAILIRSKRESYVVDQNVLRVERLKDFIERRYFEIESADDLSKKMNMSKRYIQQIFNEHFHCTPMQYLTEVRIGLVKQLLLETDNDIVSICFEAGFESLSTFYRIFKNYVGVSPNVYRRTRK
ncbi:AraC family transcriptional regulator [Geomicrobium sp. JCM 19055]|uniref:helix-turn-helix domain-containing protein n=1 Tax=Geomicrobium sp. JCM 19055 TaxID=1460649 RepID=UPI002236834E|nr:AraC family transcriptional regulator [Geomicrobium sp. JCM 19055]